MQYTARMKYVVILFLVCIFFSLGSAAWYMVKGQGGERMVRALTIRVALSVTLFLLLMAGIYFGFITQKL